MIALGRRALGLQLAAFAAVASGCAARKRPVAKSTLRVVSISPNTTEILFAVGAGDSVVGRSRYCDFPAEVASRPSIGGWMDPNFEAILALTPDLVTGARGPAGDAMEGRLHERGIATFFPKAESIAEIEQMISGLSARVSKAAEGDALLTKMRADRARIAAAIAPLPKRRALLVFGLTPIVVAGPGSFEDEVLSLAGGENPMREPVNKGSAAYASIDIERVIVIDPDIVLDAAFGEHTGDGGMGTSWKSVRAVREGRVARLEDPVVLRPGPRIANGIEAIARALHPEAFR